MVHRNLGPKDALLIVDVQNDFCSGGKLPVPHADEIIPQLNRWAEQADKEGAFIVALRLSFLRPCSSIRCIFKVSWPVKQPIVLVAQGRMLVDFGSRRAHGTDAALKAARASYLVGFHGTSNILAGKTYDLPIFGTMAHSYIQAHRSESEAFREFTSLYPETTLLVDTYDSLNGIRRVIDLSHDVHGHFAVQSVRLDSGDLIELSMQARTLLDAAGLQPVGIFASGDLDEERIGRILTMKAPIDAFGVGTRLVVSTDAPVLDMVYKLVEYAGVPRTKLSSQKVLYPGRKQVFRSVEDGIPSGDHLGLFFEDLKGSPLLRPVMIQGKRVPLGAETCREQRARIVSKLTSLPQHLQDINATGHDYPVKKSEKLIRTLQCLQCAAENP